VHRLVLLSVTGAIANQTYGRVRRDIDAHYARNWKKYLLLGYLK
jgi:hypothetical protein